MFVDSKAIGSRGHGVWLGVNLYRLIAAYKRRQAEQEMITILCDLEDHTLADIGVARDQIPAIARRIARRYR